MLRAIAAVAVVLSVAAVPRLVAQQDSAKGQPTAVMVTGPDVGHRAPTFRLPWAGRDGVGPVDEPYDLSLDRGRTVVLAFYPRDFTASGTTQLKRFAEEYDSLFGPEVVVVGISTDSLQTHSRFAAHLGLPFRLLSDPTQEVARRYASHDRSGYMRRTVYVIGADGKVQYRDLRFDPQDSNDYAQLGAAVRRSRGG
jgi:peroxiredoxin Q/BCP